MVRSGPFELTLVHPGGEPLPEVERNGQAYAVAVRQWGWVGAGRRAADVLGRTAGVEFLLRSEQFTLARSNPALYPSARGTASCHCRTATMPMLATYVRLPPHSRLARRLRCGSRCTRTRSRFRC